MGLDLHTHSRYSDGVLTPEALCALAVKKKVRTLALCDHDTTEGLRPFLDAAQALCAQGLELNALPALELSSGSDGRTHILGYGVRMDDVTLQTELRNLRKTRAGRGETMLQALRGLGVEIPPAYLPDPTVVAMPFGRPHVARALVRMGIVNTVEQAFSRYLAEGRPAYVPLEHLSPSQAVTLLRRAGAVPVLAHPMRMGLESQTLEALLTALQASGLAGVEVYHPSAWRQVVRQLDAMARRHGLLVTGGSDFHGDRDSRTHLGGLPAGWRHWAEDLQALSGAMADAARNQSVS
ncbi:MAG: PHP domain-containing protein [Candidatus Limiplasma sp.]|nr:PHP domain-containing protein [Candidatus Limiplasma sp.]